MKYLSTFFALMYCLVWPAQICFAETNLVELSAKEIHDLAISNLSDAFTASGSSTQSTLMLSRFVDLYHTIEPGFEPCERYFEEDLCGKTGMYYTFARSVSLPEYDENPRSDWTIERRMKLAERTGKEYSLVYIVWYLHENVRLEPFTMRPTMQVSEIDFNNPSIYSDFTSWMSAMVTAMALGIPPDKAEEWTLAHCNDWGGCDGLEFESEKTDEAPETDDTTAYDDTTEAVGHIGNVVKSREPEPSSPEQDEKPVNPLRVWGALGAVVLFGLSVGLFAIFRGRRKPD